ncbi:MAG TPA: WbuC family cupin fold metalloprotein [Blastocatellia bacterium]|nr:WbuC family cupin fold metalloprotein [Blastocatellia bacterium]
MDQKPIQTITTSLLDELILQAKNSPRLRAIRCFHNGDWEHCHRMLNALTPGTYVRPHRHDSDYQSEAFILLRGRLGLLLFDDKGNVDCDQSRILSLDGGILGMDIPPRRWHCLVALEDTVIYEVKGHPAGGYLQDRDKNFAIWSPEEGTPESQEFLGKLESWAKHLH